MNKKIQIPAIHDKDLRLILDKFEVSSKIDESKIVCSNCHKIITWDNLFAFKIINEESLIFFCDEPCCIENSSN